MANIHSYFIVVRTTSPHQGKSHIVASNTVSTIIGNAFKDKVVTSNATQTLTLRPIIVFGTDYSSLSEHGSNLEHLFVDNEIKNSVIIQFYAQENYCCIGFLNIDLNISDETKLFRVSSLNATIYSVLINMFDNIEREKQLIPTRRASLRHNLADHLSKRESQCLTWSSAGKTSWEIAHILEISERTVNFHIYNAIRKLGASNRKHAISIALKGNVI